ncbi:MAG: hypothetical protein MZW92_61770 [Comamonadaceae bacterium]|nr:hypothetical protein [Comamonadaceae bacterium]
MIDKTLRSPEISAEALYYLGASKEIEGVSGKFYNLTTEEIPAPPALDKEVAYELWEKSLELRADCPQRRSRVESSMAERTPTTPSLSEEAWPD